MSVQTIVTRIEGALANAIVRGGGPSAPPKLAAALRHAVFPAGQRIRPKLALSVALACGDDRPALSDAAAAAVEFLHCASLVHDDMPAFDDAAMRRGKPSVHAAFGEAAALLAGDALIVLAFETAALAAPSDPLRAAALSVVLARAVGAPAGIVAGQAWELEADCDLAAYGRAKTGALFAGAAQAGAAAAGFAPEPWATLGFRLGEAYQVADDIRDVIGCEREIGKPVGRDAALGRPNAVHALGLKRAAEKLFASIEEAAESVPDCPGAPALKSQIRAQAARFLPSREAALAAA